MRLRATLLSVLAGTALVVPASPAAAAPCTQGAGVTVVVDFASLGGGTHRECAAGDPSSGLAALRGAGFTPTRAAQEPGYFLCRINGKPANDPCQRTSPANAYWSYWHAKPGGTWAYSDLGPADYDPKPGTVEGWAFGAGKPPSSPPPSATQPSPSPAPRKTAAAPAPAATSAAPAARAGTSTPPAVAAATPAASAAAPPPHSVVPLPASTPVPSGASPAAIAAPADPTDPAADSGSSAGGPLVAAGLVSLLVIAAAVVAVRRRRVDEA